MPASWRGEPWCRDGVLLSTTKQRWRRLLHGAREHVSHRLAPRIASGGGQDGVAAVHGTGRPEPRRDGISLTSRGWTVNEIPSTPGPPSPVGLQMYGRDNCSLRRPLSSSSRDGGRVARVLHPRRHAVAAFLCAQLPCAAAPRTNQARAAASTQHRAAVSTAGSGRRRRREASSVGRA